MKAILAFLDEHLPRMYHWIVIAVGLLLTIAAMAHEQLGVLLYKVAIIAVFAVLGYWIDRSLFPYARPHVYVSDLTKVPDNLQDASSRAYCMAMLRRAIIVGACMLAGATGL